jgi:hypothetical protein
MRQRVDYEWNVHRGRWIVADNDDNKNLWGAQQGTINAVVKHLLRPAPNAGSGFRKLPLINHFSDQIYFECDLCGSKADHNEYLKAMHGAAKYVEYYQGLPRDDPIMHLVLSLCTDVLYISEILEMFRDIPHLKSIDLQIHVHIGCESLLTGGPHYFEKDMAEMKGVISNGELKGYPFFVRILDNDGNVIKVRGD